MFVLALAAIAAPRRLALGAAARAGRLDARWTRRGRYLTAQLGRTHRVSPRATRRLAGDSIALDYIDFVGQARLASGRDWPTDADAERFAEALPRATRRAFMEAEPLLVLLAHFGAASNLRMLATASLLLDARDVRGRFLVVTGLLQSRAGQAANPLTAKLYARFKDEVVHRISGGGGGIEVIEVSGRTAAAGVQIARALRTPGAVVVAHVDAPWAAPDAHRRPFAGWDDAGFATGAIALGRRAGCRAVLAFPSRYDADRWSAEVSEPVDLRTFESDAAALDYMLDEIERRIGERPAEYRVRPGRRGWPRSWDANARRWTA